jgi:hypothetical protein
MIKAFEYQLPQDQMKAMIDAMALGMIAAIDQFSGSPLARDEVEKQARRGCAQMREFVVTSAQKLTNDYATLEQLVTRFFTEGYLAMQASFIADPTVHQTLQAQQRALGVFAFLGAQQQVQQKVQKLVEQRMSEKQGQRGACHE